MNEHSPQEQHQMVAVDRVTAQLLLPMLVTKMIVKDRGSVPTRDEVLAHERERSNKTQLTFEEERRALAEAGEYTDGDYIFRDNGDHCVALSLIDDTEAGDQRLVSRDRMAISSKPSSVCYRTASTILAEVYVQKSMTIVISKERLIRHYLGYAAGDKQAYQEVADALNSLRWLEYIVWDCQYKPNRRIKSPGRPYATGNFIYNLIDTGKEYVISVNPSFVGCVQYIYDANHRLSDDERRTQLSRGYYHMPTEIIPRTKNTLAATCLLTNFLMRDPGNAKIRCAEDEKVIVYRVPRYMQEARIHRCGFSKAFRHFVAALKQCSVILRTEPTISDLERLKPAKARSVVLNVYVRRPTAKGAVVGSEKVMLEGGKVMLEGGKVMLEGEKCFISDCG